MPYKLLYAYQSSKLQSNLKSYKFLILRSAVSVHFLSYVSKTLTSHASGLPFFLSLPAQDQAACTDVGLTKGLNTE